ncbi:MULTISPECIES: hypothetical protein [Enterococcus]|jgi:hypothetical protein|uniref:hypothetical protein n=1 Tax=Enterococcus TaxID=1350 RepID=UPI000453B696|nr:MULTISPECIES: hypothetical protein [Enterococcus]EZP95979.1 hypothetical protein Z971_15435 [Enterococcus faecium VRE0576]MDB1682614.1 hypothetical protein [Enterococcus durans]PQE64728.1 hypothetical protein CUS17_07235 [Enterococcus faecium]
MAKIDDYRSDMIEYIELFAKNSNNNIIIQTGGATICGTPIDFDAEVKVNPLIDAMMDSFAEFRSKKIDDIEKDDEQSLVVKSIFLKDVTIIGERTTNIPFLVVFADQISAISLGNMD